MKEVKGVILRSENGRDGWTPVAQEHVPDWVKDPDNMRQLVAGNACCLPAEGPKGSDWYRLEVLEETDDVRAMRAAEAKRDRKNLRRLADMQRPRLLQ